MRKGDKNLSSMEKKTVEFLTIECCHIGRSRFLSSAFHARHARTIFKSSFFSSDSHPDVRLNIYVCNVFKMLVATYTHAFSFISHSLDRLETTANSFVDLRLRVTRVVIDEHRFLTCRRWLVNIYIYTWHPPRIKVELLPFDVREKSSLVSGGWRSRSRPSVSTSHTLQETLQA